ncbi:hypothetical protein C1922_17125 [Stenotrophomonas sp. ZAC14D2_NAIMI4_7]|nr:hypothetical protein C1922_17125 [Stenotrophomonas sp. ZAC14D2_NAIMI4_7]
MLGRLMMELERHQISAHVVFRALCPCLLALLLTACGSEERTPPPYEANPSPEEAYEVVVTTHDAPENIYATGAYVTYKVTNDCLPPIDNFEGVRYGIDQHSLDIPLRKVNPTTYKGTYFSDGILNLDYYGRGPCKWEIVLVGAALKADTPNSPTYFTISTSVNAGSETRYSSKNIQPLLAGGSASPADSMPTSRFIETIPDAQRGDYFSYKIAVSPRKE